MAGDTPHTTINLDLNLLPVQDWVDQSVISDETPPAIPKTDNNGDRFLKNGDSRRANLDKSDKDEGSPFDCNICLDMATEPVVTTCGHLFCWPCLYRWLYVHSDDTKECPICKGEVTSNSVTPIYSRVPRARVVQYDSGVKIPCRPQANRVESWRRLMQRNSLNIPSELLTSIFTSRGMREGLERPESGSVGSVGSVGSTLLLHGSNGVSGVGSEEGLVQSYILDHPDEWSQEELPSMEIDSRVSRRRRIRDPSRVNVDSGDPRTRRRL